MQISIAEVTTWTLLWVLLGLGFGIYTGGHVWQLIPIIGAIYGFVAGIKFSLMSYFYRAKRGEVSLPIISILGLLASTLTIPVLILITVDPKAAILFAVVVGPLSGIVVYRVIGKKYHFEVNT